MQLLGVSSVARSALVLAALVAACSPQRTPLVGTASSGTSGGTASTPSGAGTNGGTSSAAAEPAAVPPLRAARPLLRPAPGAPRATKAPPRVPPEATSTSPRFRSSSPVQSLAAAPRPLAARRSDANSPARSTWTVPTRRRTVFRATATSTSAGLTRARRSRPATPSTPAMAPACPTRWQRPSCGTAVAILWLALEAGRRGEPASGPVGFPQTTPLASQAKPARRSSISPKWGKFRSALPAWVNVWPSATPRTRGPAPVDRGAPSARPSGRRQCVCRLTSSKRMAVWHANPAPCWLNTTPATPRGGAVAAWCVAWILPSIQQPGSARRRAPPTPTVLR